MILFLISFLLIFGSSYLISSILNRENNILGLIYIFLTAFANIVFTIELLSLFSKISTNGVLLINGITFIISLLIWNKLKRPLWHINCKPFFIHVFNAMKRDKSLFIYCACFLFFIGLSIFFCIIMPVVNSDADSYHVLRCLFWIHNGSLNHFPIADSRNICLPINSEILYAWVLMFFKSETFLGFFGFTGYLLSIISTYKILDFMKYSMRKKLWVIFVLSSFASVIVQASGTETDIIIAGLVSSSLMIYWYALKKNTIVPIFMSALAYALAIGTKTPAIFAIPAIGIGMLLLSIFYKKKEYFKPLLIFLGFGIINFLLFSSYNYILNYIDFGDIAGSTLFLAPHKNFDGIKAIPANFIKYIFLYFDFTGFKWGDYSTKFLMGIRDSIISGLHLLNTTGVFSTKSQINQTLLEPLMGLGILGIIVFLPCWIISLVKPIFKRDKKTLILGFFGIALLLNIIIMSYSIIFMTFSVRFLMFFTVLSAPVLVYSYRKKGIGKFFIILFAIFYLTQVSTHLWSRNFSRIKSLYNQGYTTREIRSLATCSNLPPHKMKITKSQYNELINSGKCKFNNYIKNNFSKNTNILLYSNMSDELLELKFLDFDGYNINAGVLTDIMDDNLSKYDIIITVDNKQVSSTLNNHYLPHESEALICSDINKSSKTNAVSKYPYGTYCTLQPDYLKARGFKLIKTIEYSIIPPPELKTSKQKIPIAYFYENIHNYNKK